MNLIKVNDDIALSPYHVSSLEVVHRQFLDEKTTYATRRWGVNVVMIDGSVHFREAQEDTMASARSLLADWVSTLNRGA
jgi:hypothetical protein